MFNFFFIIFENPIPNPSKKDTVMHEPYTETHPSCMLHSCTARAAPRELMKGIPQMALAEPALGLLAPMPGRIMPA